MDQDFSLLLHLDLDAKSTQDILMVQNPKSSCVGRSLKRYIIFWALDEIVCLEALPIHGGGAK